MQIGFETIGNATLVCHDHKPVLVTDPWLTGDAYFGSWTFSHQIPEPVLESIKNAEFAWVSHGHPDHLSSRSLGLIKSKKVLLPDHVGGRICRSLKEQGYDVRVLEDRTWTKLSDHIRVLCISDYNQDGILLVDINGRLVMDLNDASDRGWGRFVRKIAEGYDKSFLLRLSGYGDADMIHFFDEKGDPVPPRAAQKDPPGKEIALLAEAYGAKYFIPFSSMHRYQRKDSLWVDPYTTRLADHRIGFASKKAELLPAFIRYDCEKDTYELINPPESKLTVRDPKEFGDDWSENLDKDDVAKINKYFRSIEHLSDCFDYINVRVGGKDHVVDLAKTRFNRGITFEAPRNSLMIAVEEEVFDDMLIGNFMKTTLHGSFPETRLYPDFTPYVGKYADNGRAKTRAELAEYFEHYKRRAPMEFLFHRLEQKSISTFRNFFHMDSSLYKLIKGGYHLIKRT